MFGIPSPDLEKHPITRRYLLDAVAGLNWDNSKPLVMQDYFAEHAAHLTKAENEGIVIMGGPWLNATHGTLFCSTQIKTDQQALDFAASDPWQEHGIIDFTVSDVVSRVIVGEEEVPPLEEQLKLFAEFFWPFIKCGGFLPDLKIPALEKIENGVERVIELAKEHREEKTDEHKKAGHFPKLRRLLQGL